MPWVCTPSLQQPNLNPSLLASLCSVSVMECPFLDICGKNTVCVVWSTGPGDHIHEQLTSLECVLIGLTPCASLFVSLITLLLRVGPHYKSRSPAKVQIYWGWKAWMGHTFVEYIYLRPAFLTKSVWVNSLDSGFIFSYGLFCGSNFVILSWDCS